MAILTHARFGDRLIVVLKHLHISEFFSLQRHVISLDGPVVTACGFKDELAVVTHASSLSSSDQVGLILMFYSVFSF